MKKLTILLTMLVATSSWAAENSDLGWDNQIYLACEAGKPGAWSYKPWGYTIKDLLENKIDLKLNKKKLKKGVRSYERRGVAPAAGGRVPLSYIDKKFHFVAFRILDKANKDNEKTICKSSHRHLDAFSECKVYKQTLKFYTWRSENLGPLVPGYSDYCDNYDSCDKDVISRDTLIYADWRSRFAGFSGKNVADVDRYQCYVSNLDEINKLATNYKGYLKPFEEEWERYASELRLKLRLKKEAIIDKNKI